VTDLAARRCRRGGNRLPPERYPPKGPTYERQRAFAPDPERRDRHQITRTRRAVALALTRGELPPVLEVVLHQCLDRCTDSLLCAAPDGGPACSGWWSERYVHSLVYPDTHDTDDDGQLASDDHTGERTAGRWMAQLVALRWLDVIHRQKVINGQPTGTSNLWRIRIPDHLRAELQAAEDQARTRNAGPHRKGRVTPTAPQNRHAPDGQSQQASAARHIAAEADRRRREPCSACGGIRWVEPDDGSTGVVRCAACDGSGAARDGPRG